MGGLRAVPSYGGNMAREKKQQQTQDAETVKAFVLRDCIFGKAREIVELSVDDARVGVDSGMLDTNSGALDSVVFD